jgi:ABC-type multidrug transport system fused ATPase/permease subunit
MRYLLRLRFFIRPYTRQVITNLMLLLGITALSLVIPEIIRRVIDIGLIQQQYTLIIQAALIILGIGLVTAFFSYGNLYLSEWVAARIGFDLRNRLYNHIQQLSFTYHDHTQTGQLISRCIEDVRAIERFTGMGIVQLVQMSLLFVGIVFILITSSPKLAVITLLPMIPLVWITYTFGKKIGKLFYAVDHALGELSARLQENITGVQVVRAFARELYEIDRFDQNNRELFKSRVTVIGEWSKIMPTTHFLVSFGTILILWFGGQMVIEGELTIGQVVAFNSYLIMLAAPVQQLAWLVNGAGEAAAGVQRVFDVLDTPLEIKSPENAVNLPIVKGEINFRNVSFAYAGEKNHALYNVNLDVQPNQIIALIGPTGSGKSSLINLIPRFYDASEGVVLIDGYDVRSLDISTLRRQIGIVLQTSLLFSDTIYANIAYGRPEASQEEIIVAAVAAQADEFIQNLPEGYDTVIGERGITLSGGQRQRVAIARALLMNPRILILDDSTSSVDTQTERLIQQALDSLMQGRTTFVIAHRLSTVHRADLILVMEKGQIVEQGTHQELLALDGLYREIYELQLRDQEQFKEAIQEIDETTSASIRYQGFGMEQE